jgi:type IV pilus assembly protein PilW
MEDAMSRAIEAAKAREGGFSLVEIMVAMTISLILLAGVLSVVMSTKVTYYENERVARIQEGGRAAFEMILRDVRGTGFPGCAQPISGLFSASNQLTDSNLPLWNFTQPLKGYAGAAAGWTPALDAPLDTLLANASANNDIVAIRRVRPNTPQFRTTIFTNATDDIQISKTAADKLTAGSTFVINDCGSETFFELSGFNDAGTTATLLHAAGAADPANQSNSLNATFQPGALVSQVDTVVYFIAPGANGPSLWRIVGNNPADEVTSGVEAMRLQYGVDTDGDTVVNEYDDADVVNAAGNWGNVVSVRIAMLVRSGDANSNILDTKSYTLLDKVFPAKNDRYQRTLFTTTVQLRNQTR